MEITLPKSQLQSLLSEAAELGASIAMTQVGLLKPYLSKNQAWTKYGRSNVERWIREGLITPRKDGNNTAKWRIDRLEIESVAKTSNRSSYNQITYKL